MGVFLVLTGAGALFGRAFWPGAFGVWAWVGLVPLLWLIDGRAPASAFRRGWWFGTVGYAVGMPYFHWTIREFLLTPPGVTELFFGLLMGLHGLFFACLAGAAAWLVPPLREKTGRADAAWLLALVPAAVALEAWFPSIIPWQFGNSQHFHLPTVQVVEVFGLAAFAVLIPACNAGVYLFVRSLWERSRARAGEVPPPLRWGLLACLGLVLSANEGWGRHRIRAVDAEVAAARKTGRTLTVALIQGCMPIRKDLRFEQFWGNLEVQNELTALALRGGKVDLVIWPESTYGRIVGFSRKDGLPVSPNVDGFPFGARLRDEIPAPAHLLMSVIGETASVEGSERRRRYNTGVLTDPSREFVDLVEKTHLIPFGESLPFGEWFPFLYRLTPRTWRLYPAPRQRLLRVPPKDISLGVVICYEDFLSEFVRRYADLGAELLVHLSNDVWFGSGFALEQHLTFGALRAVETRRFLVRAVNTGVTAVVDPAGRVDSRLDPLRRGFLVRTVVPLQGRTLYVRLGRAPYHAGTALFLAVALWAWRRRSHGR
ncbi:MAG TPA: apolipoprotein N-acyltransferase [Elusimicrobia bacterium]|nr:apolipoprotein N-acyltransferase [Elusimicrobiota bacterium]